MDIDWDEVKRKLSPIKDYDGCMPTFAGFVFVSVRAPGVQFYTSRAHPIYPKAIRR